MLSVNGRNRVELFLVRSTNAVLSRENYLPRRCVLIAHFRVLTFLETGPEFGRESEASCEVRLAGAKIKRDR